eukprot:scaffold8300_cov171-Amphora_coffeaeformis.AAC.3
MHEVVDIKESCATMCDERILCSQAIRIGSSLPTSQSLPMKKSVRGEPLVVLFGGSLWSSNHGLIDFLFLDGAGLRWNNSHHCIIASSTTQRGGMLNPTGTISQICVHPSRESLALGVYHTIYNVTMVQ